MMPGRLERRLPGQGTDLIGEGKVLLLAPGQGFQAGVGIHEPRFQLPVAARFYCLFRQKPEING